MRTNVIYTILALLLGIFTSCTPTPITNGEDSNKAPTIYGTSGEHSREPDNVKD